MDFARKIPEKNQLICCKLCCHRCKQWLNQSEADLWGFGAGKFPMRRSCFFFLIVHRQTFLSWRDFVVHTSESLVYTWVVFIWEKGAQTIQLESSMTWNRDRPRFRVKNRIVWNARRWQVLPSFTVENTFLWTGWFKNIVCRTRLNVLSWFEPWLRNSNYPKLCAHEKLRGVLRWQELEKTDFWQKLPWTCYFFLFCFQDSPTDRQAGDHFPTKYF